MFALVERWGLVAAFAAYLLLQGSAVLHGGYVGQDFTAQHAPIVEQAIADPWVFAKVATGWRTNPPLYYLLAAQLARVSGPARVFEALALVDLAANAVGLFLFWRILRRLVGAPLLRLAAMVLVLFLPFAVIHAVVISADALATPLFFLIAYLGVRLAEASGLRQIVALALAVGLAVLIGLGTKFTFVTAAGALTVLVPLLAWAGRWERRTALSAFALAAALPLCSGLAELVAYRRAISDSHFGAPEDGARGMSLRSLLFFRPADVHVLDAPPYDETVRIGSRTRVPATGSWEPLPGTEFNLLAVDRFSYPALLHLAMFTDICDFYQRRPPGSYFGRRSPARQSRMLLAVRGGILFALSALVAVPLVALRAARACLRDRSPSAARALVPILMALAFYLGIVVMMPLTTGAYPAGYWQPRLVVPALLVFFICIFVALDSLPPRARRWATGTSLVLVLAQSLLHFSFLWPQG